MVIVNGAQLVDRALGIPDLVADPRARSEAARTRLIERAIEDGDLEDVDSASPQDTSWQEAAGRAIDAVARAFDAGELDYFLARIESDTRATANVFGNFIDRSGSHFTNPRPLITQLLNDIDTLVYKEPFEMQRQAATN